MEFIGLFVASVEILLKAIQLGDDILSISEDKELARSNLQEVADWVSDVRALRKRLEHVLPESRKLRADNAINDAEKVIEMTRKFIDGDLRRINSGGKAQTDIPQTFRDTFRWIATDNKKILKYQSLLEKKLITLSNLHLELEGIRREKGLPLETESNKVQTPIETDNDIPPPSYEESVQTDISTESHDIFITCTTPKDLKSPPKPPNRWETRAFKGYAKATILKMAEEADLRRAEQEKPVAKVEGKRSAVRVDYRSAMQSEAMRRMTEDIGGLCF